MRKINIHSYRGGTGKSLIALNLAYQLTSRGNTVLLMETDVRMPSLLEIVGLHKKINTFNSFYENKCEFNETIYPTDHEISVICCDPKYDLRKKSAIFSGDQNLHLDRLFRIKKAFRQIRQRYDYCIIDSGPGWGFVQVSNTMFSEIVILVLRSGKNALTGTINMLKDVYEELAITTKKYIIIWNQLPNSKKIYKYIEKWDRKFKSLTALSFTHFIRLFRDDEIEFEIAEGNHIITDSENFTPELKKLATYLQNEL